jgi:hypothetical protein
MKIDLNSISFRALSVLVSLAFSISDPMNSAHATETITYTYDARGRVIKVERTGTVNNNLKAEYTIDKAENRTNVTVTGSPN